MVLQSEDFSRQQRASLGLKYREDSYPLQVGVGLRVCNVSQATLMSRQVRMPLEIRAEEVARDPEFPLEPPVSEERKKKSLTLLAACSAVRRGDRGGSHAILRGSLRRKLCSPSVLGLSWAPAGTLGELRDSPPGQGPLEPREASVSLNPSCAAGKQRHSPPRPAAASSRFGCRLRAARARLARGLLGGGGGGAGRGGAARPRAKKERAGPGRGAAPGPAPARSAADDDVPGSCFARVLPKTISIVTRSSGSGPCKPEDFGGPAGVDLGQTSPHPSTYLFPESIDLHGLCRNAF
ncbi:uncharacterized protein LOC142839038 [Microtus pennsylvanicus]|uniref:uncharacterized protein LOC142839038 n=1 Tax=Microtus pennsylvanicus TaxID=10058 RepID=UPI003F6D5086